MEPRSDSKRASGAEKGDPSRLAPLGPSPEGRDGSRFPATSLPLHPAPPPAEPAPLAVIALPDGWTLAVPGAAPVPVAVDRGWEAQGLAAFSGTGTYRRVVDLPFTAAWTLELPAVGETVTARLDGADLGTRVAGARRFDLGPREGRVVLELDVRNTAANRYHQGTALAAAPPPSGLLAPPRLLARRT